MKVTDLIAALSNLPPTAVVRVFSPEAQDWMPITDIDHCVLLGLGERIDLRAYPAEDEDDEDDEDGHPKYGTRELCSLCGQDIEWHGPEHGWTDRGGNRGCVPYKDKGEIVTPPADAKHAPLNANCAQGLHSWVYEPGLQRPDAPCKHCGEPYGHPD